MKKVKNLLQGIFVLGLFLQSLGQVKARNIQGLIINFSEETNIDDLKTSLGIAIEGTQHLSKLLSGNSCGGLGACPESDEQVYNIVVKRVFNSDANLLASIFDEFSSSYIDNPESQRQKMEGILSKQDDYGDTIMHQIYFQYYCLKKHRKENKKDQNLAKIFKKRIKELNTMGGANLKIKNNDELLPNEMKTKATKKNCKKFYFKQSPYFRRSN